MSRVMDRKWEPTILKGSHPDSQGSTSLLLTHDRTSLWVFRVLQCKLNMQEALSK